MPTTDAAKTSRACESSASRSRVGSPSPATAASGYKARYAQAAGAVALIIYSDPANGGYVAGPEYPEGPYLTASTVQRGSVLTLPYAGDPLTPFVPALPATAGGPERLDPMDVAFHEIPVIPIPHGSAIEVLERMKGPAVPQDWQGGLPFTYRLSGGAALRVRARVEQPFETIRIANVVGTLEGSRFAEEWVMLGSHYDAWGFGAIDPNGGTAMLLTLADALGKLAREGLRSARTIKIAHWDAEEFGMIGSTEWVEQFREQIEMNAVAYINADSAVTGDRFTTSSSPSLKAAIADATRSVTYPGSEHSVYEHWLAGGTTDTPPFGNLGGGSDHVAFYTHLGVPSAGLSMSGSAPVYHSNYDTFAWFERFGDSDFSSGPALARVDGVLALRLANADLLPYDVPRYASDLLEHSREIKDLATAHDVPYNADPLRNAIHRLELTGGAFQSARDEVLVGPVADDEELSRLNADLIALEKAFLSNRGLQNRPWSRSLYAAPDPFAGYASWMLPGLRYEIETGGRNITEWLGNLIAAIDDLNGRIVRLTVALQRSPKPTSTRP